MLEGLLRTVAVVAGAIVLLSFALFAIDETRDFSQASQDAVAGLDATRSAEPTADILVAPFAGIVSGSQSSWVRRGVPSLLALIVWGFGLSFLARYARGRA